MKAFHYHMPVEIFFGENCVRNNPQVFKRFGNRAMIVTYELPAPCRHYALEDVIAVLDEIGSEYLVCTDVKEDPPLSVIEAIAETAVKYDADYIVAIGGGAPMDAAKCISVLMKHPGEDSLTVLNTDPIEGVPIIAIPTTCGTGSECTCWSCITREDLNIKCGIAAKIFAKVAFCDARYIAEFPLNGIRNTSLDALCHGIESYLNANKPYINNFFAEAGVKLFSSFKDGLITGEFTPEQRQDMMLAATLAGVAITECGCTLPHALSYPYGVAHHVPHGPACAVTLVPYLRLFKDRTEVDKLVHWAGFADLDEMDTFIKKVLDVTPYGTVTADEIEAWADEISTQKQRFAVHPEPAGRDEVVRMYTEAFFK